MASSSTNPNEVIQPNEDEDEFDWEAAVREIDVTCQSTLTSNSRQQEKVVVIEEEVFTDSSVLQPVRISHQQTKKSNGSGRQSTLDNFVRTIDRKSLVGNSSHPQIVVAENDNGGDCNGIEDMGLYSNVDLQAAKTWIYPVNIPVRDYQLSITKTALFTNTLVALPTGLGKTLIAAVVMYNYFRWFPKGKIVFAAPSRPLVMQQIEACHNIVGIPQEWTIDMTGQIAPPKRLNFWKEKRVFYVTPQVLEKDIISGICPMKDIVCLVIDEAHRATGDYSYCVVVRELMAMRIPLRILALTATPGSKQQTIQMVIDNLYISKLEYRNESHHDVSRYVHDRKLELIEVPMSDDAIEVNRFMLEAIQPFVSRLNTYGVLRSGDLQTLSPCELLNFRDKFRQAPPQSLPQVKYGEVEGYFGVLITLYHMRKLLSSHGIRPAYEMLEEKLQQGSFSRLLGRNEVVHKTKLLMQRSLSHGAPSPKLSKMIEVLIDHFKKHDPKNSRVIIFSNFRGSVRDIMDSLSSIGELVKATEFIGQSSGKASKGQTQKTQQAVLQKFRAGGYNVIVATSIGEEGLDIMEVDLVICFDANISPLRMIQRMGRTGRKHDGRVVILACEGSELKGYLRKQANNKAVKKHMNNGGMNSFNFHSSPRMIPHICKPEVQFVELSIEQFVHRGRKVKDDSIDVAEFPVKPSDAEMELLAKYFPPPEEYKWRPSLIAFPHFQVFPSRVHKVRHSFRTRMLIDSMQRLQELAFSEDTETVMVEGETSSQPLKVEIIAKSDSIQEDRTSSNGSPKAKSEVKIKEDVKSSPILVLRCNEKNTIQNQPTHCFLYGKDFVSVDSAGKILISFVPDLPFGKETVLHKSTTTKSVELWTPVEEKLVPSVRSPQNYMEIDMQAKSADNPPNRLNDEEVALSPKLCQALHGVESGFISTPSPKRNLSNTVDTIFETPAAAVKRISAFLDNEPITNFIDMEMSPRLTDMVEEGLVPDSPIEEAGYSSSQKDPMICKVVRSQYESCELNPAEVLVNKLPAENMFYSEDLFILEDKNMPPSLGHSFPTKLPNGMPSKSSGSEKNEQVKMNTSPAEGVNVSAPINEDVHTPLIKNYSDTTIKFPGSHCDDNIRTPLVELSKNSCSKDWRLSSGESSKSVKLVRKFKRLRKYGNTNIEISRANLDMSFASMKVSRRKHVKDKQKRETNIGDFIEEEAEVSSDAEVSDDEEDKVSDSDDDSFIDDRLNPTPAVTQSQASGKDMMAIYRRSLLTQPVESPLIHSTNLSPDLFPRASKMAEIRSSKGKTIQSQLTPQTGPVNQSTFQYPSFCEVVQDQNSPLEMPLEPTGAPKEETKIESRKRKLSFCQPSECQEDDDDDKYNGDVSSDDQFFEGVDLDELEAQATKILKSQLSVEGRQCTSTSLTEEKLVAHSPSFDLGI